ncbi:TPA: hypothetical protein ACGF3P_003349 [Vibrio cholerae]
MRIQENLNTVVGSAGFLLALFTAYHQFGFTPDKIDVESKLVRSFESIFTKKYSFTDLETNFRTDVAGPVYWKITIYNPSDRPVTIKEQGVELITDKGDLVQYRQLVHSVFNQKNNKQTFPLTLESRKAYVLFLGLNLKVTPKISSCYGMNSSVYEVELCSYRKGVDIFGNQVDYKEFISPVDTYGYNVFFGKDVQSPEYVLTFKTGDGNKFRTRLAYY